MATTWTIVVRTPAPVSGIAVGSSTRPSTCVVATFVGADRLLKLMAVTDIEGSMVDPSAPGDEGLPTVTEDATLREASLAILASAGGRVRVTDSRGTTIGALTLDHVRQILTQDRNRAA